MNNFDYKLIRSKRRSISLEITPALEIVVRAPLKMSGGEIERFVKEHSAWIEKHTELQRERQKT